MCNSICQLHSYNIYLELQDLNFNSNKLDNKHMLKAAIEKIIIDMLLRNITFNDNIIV